MSSRKPKMPRLRPKPSGGNLYAVAKFNGRERSFGRWDNPSSVQSFHAFAAEWEAAGRDIERLKATAPVLRIRDLERLFMEHAQIHYRHPDGTPTREATNFEHALRHLTETCGEEPIESFDSTRLEAVRDSMLSSTERCPGGLARNTVNARVRRIKQVFRWGKQKRIVPATVVAEITDLPALPKGRSRARETREVPPVSREAVDATLPHVSPAVAAMIELQWLSGMRPGEVVRLRPKDLDRSPRDLPLIVNRMNGSADLWAYCPPRHKNAWRQQDRRIFLNPHAQRVLEPFLLRVPRPSPEAALFQPTEHPRTDRGSQAAPRTFTTTTYARAILRGICAANALRARTSIDSALSNLGLEPAGRIQIATAALVHEMSATFAPNLIALERAIRRLVAAPEVARATRIALETIESVAPLARWSPNQLRHSCGTITRLEHGADCAQVVLGHRSATSTERYARPDTSLDWAGNARGIDEAR